MGINEIYYRLSGGEGSVTRLHEGSQRPNLGGHESSIMSIDTEQDTDSSEIKARQIQDMDGFDRLIANNERVLVDFYADWCGPCQLMASTVDELAAESAANVVKVDVEDHPQLSARYDIKKIPTFLVFENGAIEERLVGMQSKEALLETIE